MNAKYTKQTTDTTDIVAEVMCRLIYKKVHNVIIMYVYCGSCVILFTAVFFFSICNPYCSLVFLIEKNNSTKWIPIFYSR